MKILSIGNSFSQDAHKWLSQIAESCNEKMEAVNLFIGGCSLETHWKKYESHACDYELEINGQFVRKVSLNEALKLQKWDVVTFQQASPYSGDYNTYQPYLQNLYGEVKKVCGDVKYYIHQTWSYEIDSENPAFARYNNSQRYMYDKIKAAYKEAAKAINAEIIPVGDIIQHLRENVSEFDYKNGGLSLNRDGFHLSLLYGRYAAALVWYSILFGKDICQVNFIPQIPGQIADEKILETIKNSIYNCLKKY